MTMLSWDVNGWCLCILMQERSCKYRASAEQRATAYVAQLLCLQSSQASCQRINMAEPQADAVEAEPSDTLCMPAHSGCLLLKVGGR